jgi:hypothetical protein
MIIHTCCVDRLGNRQLTLEPERLFPVVVDHVNRAVAKEFGEQVGSCIEATGTTLQVLRNLGFRAMAPLSVELQVLDRNLADLVEHGRKLETRAIQVALGDLTSGPPVVNGTWRGHLVTACENMILDPTVEQARRFGLVDADKTAVFTYDQVFLSLQEKEYFWHRPDPNGPGYAYRPSPGNDYFRQFRGWTESSMHSRLADEVTEAIWADPRVSQTIEVGKLSSFEL